MSNVAETETDTTQATEAGTTMRIRIDQERCQGHGRCYALAPELVEPDEIGNGREIGGGIVAPEHVAAARKAQANCPEDAVIIEGDV